MPIGVKFGVEVEAKLEVDQFDNFILIQNSQFPLMINFCFLQDVYEVKVITIILTNGPFTN